MSLKTVSLKKIRIAASFAAASAYEQAAVAQRLAADRLADRLADRIAGLDWPANPRVLEIGCGTGFLTRAVLARMKPSFWLATDIAPAMLARCRDTVHDDALRFACMDGEAPATDGGFDLVCSNMAFQWFERLEASVARLAGLLRPGGILAFSTLSAGSFQEWRDVHHELGLQAGTPDYPDAAALSAMWLQDGDGRIDIEEIVQRYANARAFVSALKDIGADVAPDRRPLTPGAFRRVLRAFGSGKEVSVTYRIAYGVFRKGDGP